MPLSLPGTKLSTRDLAIFGVLGGVMFLSQVAMQGLPNVHLITLFTAAFTLAYRVRALIPFYIYVLLSGVYYGFHWAWVPRLYIWLPLWAAFMIFGALSVPKKIKIPLAMILCAIHGFAFGLMYAPFQAIIWGLSFQGMIAWIVAGIPFDIIHGVSNFASGVLVIPLASLLTKLDRMDTL